MRESFLIKEWMRSPSRILILLYLRNNRGAYASKIKKNLKINFRCVYDGLKYFFKNELIYDVKGEGRKKHIFLTEKGKEIAKRFYELDRLLSLSS